MRTQLRLSSGNGTCVGQTQCQNPLRRWHLWDRDGRVAAVLNEGRGDGKGEVSSPPWRHGQTQRIAKAQEPANRNELRGGFETIRGEPCFDEHVTFDIGGQAQIVQASGGRQLERVVGSLHLESGIEAVVQGISVFGRKTGVGKCGSGTLKWAFWGMVPGGSSISSRDLREGASTAGLNEDTHPSKP